MATITIFNEFIHERKDERVRAIYPDGIHACLASALGRAGRTIHTATLEEPEHALTEDRLAGTDVLIWWGHMAHDKVRDDIVDRVQRRVLEGMGLIVLHSGHYSKIFRRLLGTTCSLCWREADERERLWVCQPGHPIAQGIDRFIELDQEEMYGEPFAVPTPDETIFVSWFEGGEVFRSGLCYRRGNGKIFYFRPGHESYPTYHHPQIQRVIDNAIGWAMPEGSRWIDDCPNVPVEQARETIGRR